MTFLIGQVTEAVMAGIGEHNIINMLSRYAAQVHACHRLILQPDRRISGVLRPFLAFNGWKVVHEEFGRTYIYYYFPSQ